MLPEISCFASQDSPHRILKSLALKEDLDICSLQFAQFLDKNDSLASFRKRFCYPKKKTLPHVDVDMIDDPEEECIYMCGNSLGLKPKETDDGVNAQLKKWAEMGVQMHFVEPLPAAACDNYGREAMGRLVGADPKSVVLMNGLSVNLHLLLISFYQPTNQRYKILIEKDAFPSDRYAVRSQAKIRGFDPSIAVLEVAPRPKETTIRTEDILELINREGDSIAVICLSGVQYYTGQKFDMEVITRAGQAKGCLVGWDLAHAVGNVDIRLDDWNVDFACWCTYKYMNSGPGCIAGAYVNRKHNKRNAPNLHGWWSNKLETRFKMEENCDLAEGVDRFKLSNPPPLLVSCVISSLKIFDDATMDKILQKQLLLTGYLEYLLDNYFDGDSLGISSTKIITPRNPNERGCQLSLVFSFSLKKVHDELEKRGVVCDIRQPNVMRIAPAPLYNSFSDVYRFFIVLKRVLKICKSCAA